jgi:hypothetical protein
MVVRSDFLRKESIVGPVVRNSFSRRVMAFIGAVGIAASLSACGGSSASPDTTGVVLTKNAALVRPKCDAVTPCKIGDTGKGGGTIFYVSQTGFPCGATMTATCNFKEYAPMNWSAQGGNTSQCTRTVESRDLLCSWSLAPTLTGAKALTDGLSAGLANTSLLQSASANAIGGYDSNAAVAARNYTGSNVRSAYYLQDWYIPTLTEAVELCKYANGNAATSSACTPGSLKPEFTADNYWTSNPASTGVGTNATALHFGTGVAAPLDRTSVRLVRPIRSFAGTLNPSAEVATTTVAPTTTVRATTTLAPTTTVRATTTTVLSCALGGSCAVGNVGPAGGTVIYANAAGFACGASRTGTCRYLEAAPANWYTTVTTTNCAVNQAILTCRWSDVNLKLAGTGNTGIGYGLQNTNSMVAQSSTAGNAGVVARAYRGGGFADWALPSVDELVEVCKYAKLSFPGNSAGPCSGLVRTFLYNNISNWSSNDTSASNAPAKSFLSAAAVTSDTKSSLRSILPIRAF